MSKFNASILVFLLSCLALPAQAKRFTSKYCEFELPIGWECILEGSEYVCQSTNDDRKKEAIIILAAKTRGPQDTLADYQQYLQSKKTFTLPGGKTQVSDPKYTQKKNIADHVWIDSLHLASEVPGFYTRYLATVKEDLGVAVTFSVSRNHYDAYKDVFDAVVATLKVFRPIADGQSQDLVLKQRDDDLLSGSNIYIPAEGPKVNLDQQARKGSFGSDTASEFLFYVLIALGVGIFLYIKKKKKKK